MKKGFLFWKRQIASAQAEHREFLSSAEKLESKYADGSTRLNVFYGNVQTLKSALLPNSPRPEVMRRAENALEGAPRSEADAMAARAMQGAVDYYFSKSEALTVAKCAVENACKIGRGVIWVEYIPEIERSKPSAMQRIGAAIGIRPDLEEHIADQKISLASLGADEYLQSAAKSEKDAWWRARRHLMSAEDIRERFGYEPAAEELNFESDKDTARKMGEVWEIWDKPAKRRAFILMSSLKNELLEDAPDPYGLDAFFPAVPVVFLRDSKTGLPIAEYRIYRKLEEQLNGLAEKNKNLQKAAKYIQLVAAKDADTQKEITDAEDGAIISVRDWNPNLKNIAATLDISQIEAMIDNNVRRMNEIKAEIWEAIGIADIMRGASDPNETAEAQKIKGLFGGLRFKDRQEEIQKAIKKVFQIIAELIAEHWEWPILSAAAGIELPTNAEKIQMSAAGRNIEIPAQEEVLRILRSGHIRDFVVDVESSATVFDDLGAQARGVEKLTGIITAGLQMANQTGSPEDMGILITLAKMNMAGIKVSSSISSQFIRGLESKKKALEEKRSQPPPPPQPSPDVSARIAAELEKARLDAETARMEMQARLAAEREKLAQQMQIEIARIDIERARAATKRREIEEEAAANAARIGMNIAPDTNLG